MVSQAAAVAAKETALMAEATAVVPTAVVVEERVRRAGVALEEAVMATEAPAEEALVVPAVTEAVVVQSSPWSMHCHPRAESCAPCQLLGRRWDHYQQRRTDHCYDSPARRGQLTCARSS